MNVEKNVPVLRFEGFSDEWVEKPLNHEVELFSGLTYSPKDIRKEGVFVIRSSNVKNGQIVQADNVYVNPEVVNCSNVKKGDIIVVVRNGSRALIGKHAQVNSLMDNTVIGAFMTGVRASYPEFINALFDTDKFKAQVEKNLGATINQITNGAFNSMVFMFPEGQEKTAIGNTFQKLDNLINQHQQKHDKLSNIKKAMLEKMFPKQGENIPEIRFKGFSGDWEEIRLGDMVTCFSGGTPLVGVEEYYKGNIPFIRSAEINKASTELTISESGLKNSSAKIVEVGTVLYALYGATSGEVGRAKLSGAINQAILAIIPMAKMCPEFLSHWLRKSKNSIISTYLQGGQGNLSGDIVKNLVLMSPTFEEQIAIGNYFQKLDTLINQHQQQITKLNNIKQACLSKMFV